MTKPPDIDDIVRTIIRSGDRIKAGTATKICKVAVSPYFNRQHHAILRCRTVEWDGKHLRKEYRIDTGYCLDQTTGEN
jgi:hypothetical protein